MKTLSLFLPPGLLGLGVLFPLLPGLHPGLRFGCETNVVSGSTDCLTATATGISVSGVDVSVAGMDVNTKRPCGMMSGVILQTYVDQDGERGFKNPPDIPVGQLGADVATPTDHVHLGSFSNQGAGGLRADSWEITVNHPDGSSDHLGGSFRV
ncbi:MAG: hypothetical protein ACE5H3_03115 [Planctomycetota bacterium]